MKKHLVKLSLALLSAVFILGCQDQGSGVVGPDGLVPQFAKGGGKGKPGGGGGPKPKGVLVDVIVTDGMKTNSDQVLEMEQEGGQLDGLAPVLLEVAMTVTYGSNELGAAWRQDICETGKGDTADDLMDDVFSNLLQSETASEVSVLIDTSALPNGDHRIWVTNGPRFVVVSPSMAAISGDINSNSFTVTFSGGRLKLGRTDLNPSKPNKFASELFCDNRDVITFTVGGG